MSDNPNAQEEYGPLGPGHAPLKDPLKGLRGVLSATHILQAITVFLALTVVLKIDEGSYWIPFNWGFIVLMGSAHVIMAFLQRFDWAMPVTWVMQAIGVVGGLFVHWSVSVIYIIFAGVWWYVVMLRDSLIERMRRGLLTTQHLGPEPPKE